MGDEVRPSIEMGGALFPICATPGDASMKGYNSVWEETH